MSAANLDAAADSTTPDDAGEGDFFSEDTELFVPGAQQFDYVVGSDDVQHLVFLDGAVLRYRRFDGADLQSSIIAMGLASLHEPTIALSPLERPRVAYVNSDQSVTTTEFDGSIWRERNESALAEAEPDFGARLAIDHDDRTLLGIRRASSTTVFGWRDAHTLEWMAVNGGDVGTVSPLPDFAFDADNNAHFAMIRDGGTSVSYATAADATSGLTWEQVDSFSLSATVQVDVDGTNRPHVIVAGNDATRRRVIEYGVFNGSRWTLTEFNNEGAITDVVDIACLADGRAALVWNEDSSLFFAIFDGTTHSDPVLVNGDATVTPEKAVIQVDSLGNVHIAYGDAFGVHVVHQI